MTAVDQMPGTGTGTGAAPPASGDVTTVRSPSSPTAGSRSAGACPSCAGPSARPGSPTRPGSRCRRARRPRSRSAGPLKQGAELILVWGGDGMVQRCIDTLAGSDVTVGIIPAGTANLLAKNLGIPHDLGGALEIALAGRSRRLDVGVVNGEHFTVMAGAGFDARMIEDADRDAKAHLGRLAYVRSGAAALRAGADQVHVVVDGVTFYEGPASCVLVGNVPRATGGLLVFNDAEPDDGRLDVGVVTAEGTVQWLRVLGKVALHRGDTSPFVQTIQGRTIDVRFEQPVVYELDGGTRPATDRLRFEIKPAAITVRVPGGDR